MRLIGHNRLEPAPGSNDLVERDSSIFLRIGPIRWLAAHTVYDPPRLFVDEQVEGPFATWVHRHEFEAVDATTTRLTDRVTFTLPGGPLVNALFGRVVAWSLVPMFRFRHAATKAACEAPGRP